jgi:uncharacterized BrkB/YihY/UPF0761 family membrane protein
MPWKEILLFIFLFIVVFVGFIFLCAILGDFFAEVIRYFKPTVPGDYRHGKERYWAIIPLIVIGIIYFGLIIRIFWRYL